MLFKEKYSLFADIGDLSKYSFDDLKRMTLSVPIRYYKGSRHAYSQMAG
jgi:hypothetical protein